MQSLCAPVVARWCRQAGLQPADVDDVLQEVFAKLVQGLSNFRHDRGSGSFCAWLYTVARTRLSNHYERQGREPPAVGGSSFHERLEQAPAHAGAEELSSAAATLHRRALDLVRAEFEERTWQAFWRSCIEERPTEEIAGALEMTPNAVRQAKKRVLDRLREEFGDLLE